MVRLQSISGAGLSLPQRAPLRQRFWTLDLRRRTKTMGHQASALTPIGTPALRHGRIVDPRRVTGLAPPAGVVGRILTEARSCTYWARRAPDQKKIALR